MTLNREHWVSSLIRLALPYARQRIMVVLPPHQVVAAPVFRDANARSINLECLPLNHFPEEKIEAMRHQYLVQPKDVNAMEYSEEIQAAFGESPQHHLDLLPERVRAQLEL